MRRRAILQFLSTVAAWPLSARVGAQTAAPAREQLLLRALAEVVLPQEIGPQNIDRVTASFQTWGRAYRADADAGHGYGFTRPRRTPASPATKYSAQLEALDKAARAGGRSFADLTVADRRTIVEAALAAARIERLPARPDGGHVATDLMGFYFNSIEANDLAYGARIGRDTCRTLAGSGDRPAPLTGGR